MVLESQKDTDHNATLGRKIQHPPSTKFHDDDILPPAKRLRAFESTDGEDSCDVSDDEAITRTPNSHRDEILESDGDIKLEEDYQLPAQRPTELESALPPIKTDKEAIVEYESMRAAGQDIPGDVQAHLGQSRWTKGKSSIYVDAFNLALETVLEDEGHLFDEKEMEVFNQWKGLEYEAQYL